MSDSLEKGRKAQLQRGKPASGAKSMSGNRSQRRAYEFMQRKNFEEDWNKVREFEERPIPPRAPTERSSGWKEKLQRRKAKPARDDPAVSYDFKATSETSPIDEPLYDLGPHTSSIPVQETYSQNVDLSGYIDQVERTYETLRGIDPRLDRRMPFSMFQHSMCSILNCYLMDLTLDNGERKLGAARAQDMLPEDLIIPDNLFHYMASIGNTTTVNGEEIKFNLPDIAVPQAQDVARNIPAGSFGDVNAQTHNVYECYISPLVTSNRVLNSRRGNNPPIDPLPAALTPAGSVPTDNLLGWGPPDILPPEARPRIEGFEFPDGDSEAARLRLCPELMSRVNTVLFELRHRFKMRDIGRESPSVRHYIKPKPIPGNVQFVRVPEAVPDVQRLSSKQCQIRCCSAFGSSTAGYNNVSCIHRERTNNARGACYVVNGALPAGWNVTINSNFAMAAPFLPTIGVSNPSIRTTKFISHSPNGSRLTAVDNYIKKNYYVPSK